MPEIHLIKGDITHFSADAIVNAAHEGLTGGGGVDGAIHRAAGPALMRECMAIDEVFPGIRCPIGEARITWGGGLPAKYVIHTVSPRFVGSSTIKDGKRIYVNLHPETEAELRGCYTNCMALARRHCLSSIAFPSLGSGGHAWPVEVAAPIAIGTVFDLMKNTDIKVTFVLFTDSDLKAYRKAHEQCKRDCSSE